MHKANIVHAWCKRYARVMQKCSFMIADFIDFASNAKNLAIDFKSCRLGRTFHIVAVRP